LQSFAEETDPKYKTFYLTEKRKPRDLPTSSDPASPKAKKKKESENSTLTKVLPISSYHLKMKPFIACQLALAVITRF